MTDFRRLLALLSDAGVEFMVIGGAAATAHGSVRLTLDLDILYRRTKENFERISRALAGLSPYLRDAPPGLPFRFDAATIQRGLNFTLSTELGDLDLLGELVGLGTYDDVLPNAVELELFGTKALALGLSDLIANKRALGRGKDLDALAELEALAEEKDRPGPPV